MGCDDFMGGASHHSPGHYRLRLTLIDARHHCVPANVGIAIASVPVSTASRTEIEETYKLQRYRATLNSANRCSKLANSPTSILNVASSLHSTTTIHEI